MHRLYSYDKALSANFFRTKLFNPEVQLAQNLNTKFLRARIISHFVLTIRAVLLIF